MKFVVTPAPSISLHPTDLLASTPYEHSLDTIQCRGGVANPKKYNSQPLTSATLPELTSSSIGKSAQIGKSVAARTISFGLGCARLPQVLRTVDESALCAPTGGPELGCRTTPPSHDLDHAMTYAVRFVEPD